MISALFEDQRMRWALLAGVMVVGGLALLYGFYDRLGPMTVAAVYDPVLVAVALSAVIGALKLWRSSQRGEQLRRVWGWLAVGLFLWAVAEAVWGVFELFLRQDPFPSLADVAWTAGYAALFAALVLRFRSLRTALPYPWVLVLIGAAGLAIAVAFVMMPILSSSEYSLLEKVLSTFYGVGDLIVGLTALACVFVLIGGRLSWPWTLVTAGLLLMTVCDLLYYYADLNGIYGGPTLNLITALADVPYLAAYAVLALGLYSQIRLEGIG
jgi:hypothetical protein